jgi:septal ring factor EnvC (AmiA/AmiB activator)
MTALQSSTTSGASENAPLPPTQAQVEVLHSTSRVGTSMISTTRARQLEMENERLARTIEELQAGYRELQAGYQESQAGYRELQATNQELQVRLERLEEVMTNRS